MRHPARSSSRFLLGAESREGRRIAQLFRKARQPGDGRACNLDEILIEDKIELATSESEDPGYAACLIRGPQVSGVILPKDQSGGRRRFSIAHELGHFHIPSHVRAGLQGSCFDADLRARSTDAKRQEWEANDFAAELLMPQRLFSTDVSARDVSIASATDLASTGMYDVSVLAAAWRLVQTTREAAALVVSTEGRVTWVAKSDAFRLWLTERNQLLHPGTLAAAGFRREGFADRPRAVPMGAWLEQTTTRPGVLLESTYGIDRLNQVVSLLWHVESELTGDDE